MSPELQEVLEFMRDNVPTKTELNEFRQHVDARFDEIESKLDFSERLRLVEQRIGKLEDDKTDGKFVARHAV
jgi:tetrahydromethanopterin S-methyltransferase subunit G